jgi:hypothetical protein
MRILIFSCVVAHLVMLSPSSVVAGWLIFHEPAFSGKILDIDTKRPIEGVVVVARYMKATMGLGSGTISSTVKLQEAVTDINGNFEIPSYSTVIQPFSWQTSTVFIVYKDGYASLELALKDYFTGEKQAEQDMFPWTWARELKVKFRTGVVELPKIRTQDERRSSKIFADIFSGEITKESSPLLYKALND